MDVVNKINTLTSDYNGMQVPVRIEVNEDGSFTVSVGTPPTTALLKEEAGIEKGASDIHLYSNAVPCYRLNGLS